MARPSKEGEGEGKKRKAAQRSAMQRTGVHPSDVLDGREEKHQHDAHAKDLDAAPGHVEHEGLHGEGFGGGDGEVPCAFFFEGGVGGGGCGCGFGGRPCLVGWGVLTSESPSPSSSSGGFKPEEEHGGDVRG